MSKYNDNAHPTQVAYADGIKYGLELAERTIREAYLAGFDRGYDCCDAVEAHEASVSEKTAELCYKQWVKSNEVKPVGTGRGGKR